MHVVTGLHKLFKAKKAYIRGAKGVWEGVTGEGGQVVQRGGRRGQMGV
jgi:hypothetical protein